MGKISPVSAKYIIHASIEIDGVVDRPDVIGAIFGQTEGLLGSELELRELQRSGRIGRIEVNVDTKGGRSKGEIVVPSSLDKAETVIIGAAFEIIQRIGPCNAKIRVENIEDVRISKRQFVVQRAKELLKNLIEDVMPDSQEIAEEVAHSVRVMEIREYGKDRLPAGPAIEESDDLIVVEGRADVLVLLKNGVKNAIAMNGTSTPQTIIDLSRQKETTIFVDGDRGGDLNVKEMLQVADIDFVTKAPDGKEVEELTKKEIHQALRNKIAAEQYKMDPHRQREVQRPHRGSDRNGQKDYRRDRQGHRQDRDRRAPRHSYQKSSNLSDAEKSKFKSLLEDLIGTKGVYIVDEKLNILGKVPSTELLPTVKSLGSGVNAVILDGSIDKELVEVADRSRIRFLIGMESKVRPVSAKTTILTAEDL